MSGNIRRCKVTQEPMEQGYVVNFDEYIKDESNLVKAIISYLDSIKDWSVVDKDTLIEVSYVMEFHYWTQWDSIYLEEDKNDQ